MEDIVTMTNNDPSANKDPSGGSNFTEIAKRYQGKKVCFVSGLFNVLHAGHLRLLRFAKECGDVLVVGILGDEHSSTYNHVPQEQRLRFVQSIDWIDEAVILQQSVIDTIQALRPSVVVKGKEHENTHNEEAAVVSDCGAKLLFSAGESSFTFGEIIRIQRDVSHSSIVQPDNFLLSHGSSKDRLLELLDIFSDLSVCIVGDTIVDEYVHCDPLGMSQEDPTLVVMPTDTERFIGGGAIVASHIRALGASDVSFASVLGSDSVAEFVNDELAGNGVKALFLEDESRPTTLKQRFRSRDKTLLRVNQLRQHQISQELQIQLFHQLADQIPHCNLMLFTDFNYGVLPQLLVDKLCELADKHGVMMVADSQSSSQIGDISRFKGMSLIAPTEHEARIAMQNNEDGLVVLAEKLRQRARAKHVLITLGEDGLLIHADAGNPGDFLTDRLPAFNQRSKDNAGAGDCLLATAAMAMAVGGNLWEGSYLGSLAAAIQVGRLGNRPLEVEELRSMLQE
jgi:rfaE bifunctional protein kinase chain/domain